MIAAVLNDKTVDWNFRRHARKLNFTITKGRQSNIAFPDRARAVGSGVSISSFGISSYNYIWRGPSVSATSWRGPLVLLFVLGFGLMGAFSALNTLMVDLYPQDPGTAAAANNLVRCWRGAGAVVAVGPLLNTIGTGWMSVLVAGVWALRSPLIWAAWRWGPRWREERKIMEEMVRAEDVEKRKTTVGALEQVMAAVIKH